MKPNINIMAFTIATSLLLSGCNDNNDKHSILIKDHYQVNKIQGVWDKKAYGTVLSIADGRIKHYEYNSYACTQISDKSYQEFVQDHVGMLLITTPHILDIIEKDSVQSETLFKVEELPVSCKTPIQATQSSTPSQVFEYFWHSFNDYYAFFELRDIDWQAQYTTYARQIHDSMTDEELFDVLAQMVAPLQDAHVSINEGSKYFSNMKPAPLLRSAHGKARSYLRFGLQVDSEDVINDMLADYYNTTASYVTTDSFKSFPQDTDSNTLIWGVTPDNVGILVINNMAHYHSDTNATEKEQLAAAKALINTVMSDLKDTDGLILDIRNNLGGNDVIATIIANHFTDKRQMAYKKQAINRSGRTAPKVFLIGSESDAYTKPVYMLTSQMTVSAGEVFAMAMKQLPHVTQVGEETSGAFSDILSFTLPNGWEIGLSNEVYNNAKGESFELSGLQPDVHISAYTNLENDLQRFATYNYALKVMGKQTSPQISINDFEQQVTRQVAQGEIPGLAVAVINNGKIRYAKGFGIADEQNTPVNADTPFYIASLSKTLVGATLAHAITEQTISLDENISALLPFAIDVTPAQQTPVTLRHLVTHTSGIIDATPAYLCAYYIHETKQNMSDAMLGTNNCDPQINPDLSLYLSDYLNRDGRYYQPANFTSQYGFNTNEVYIYSNIATAVAAYALEQKCNTPFVELAQNYIFTPLNMQNSTWGVGKPDDNVATRFVYHPETGERIAMPNYGAITYADGSAISTVNDLARFLIASMNHGKIGQQQVLSATAVETMLSPQTTTPVPSRDIGYFWELDGDYIHHDGSDPGVMSRMIGNLKTQNGVILLSNGDDNHEANYEALNTILHLALQLADSN
ncbi:serine hydrolase [Pseudoalteromonas sp. JBTF-M23]|uniref:Serine hydrolase n=1 Tax=Pseudoalteromonas caenipelagi TaxID=2726988 RepID=A0A849VGR5_9GAMM|nr:serine hydrolase [Pseudoalteromonas caenipelagi]NOU52929.1 serine hydrolase [Pseudoalteromonas caenipelagi]